MYRFELYYVGPLLHILGCKYCEVKHHLEQSKLCINGADAEMVDYSSGITTSTVLE